MATVSNLDIKLQDGTENTYFATWTFGTAGSGTGSGTGSSTTGGVKTGDLVSIASNATYYNGKSMPTWVKNLKWYLVQVKGDRAVLGKDQNGDYNIQSAVNTKYLTTTTSSAKATTKASSASSDQVDHYEVQWFYDTGNSVWFSGGGKSDVEEMLSTYSPPSNALRIKVSVTPVSKTYETTETDTSKNNWGIGGASNTTKVVEKPYWTGTASTKILTISTALPPPDPATPDVEIDKFKLTATLDNIDNDVEHGRTDKIQFEVYNGDTKVAEGVSTVLTQRAVFVCSVTAGGKYRVRCRAIYVHSTGDIYSENWSSFSSEKTTVPTAISKPTCKADSSTSVIVSWGASSTATGYTIEYTTKKEYFDSSSSGVSTSSVTNTTAYITGLSSGEEWFFRVRATNEEGDSEWSSIVSVVIGSKPQPPTTWSLTTTAIVGDDVTLYWVHNSEDGSKQVAAEIELTIDGKVSTITVDTPNQDDEEDEPTYSYVIKSSTYGNGATILWKVRTKGITNEYGDWSTQRTVELFAPPTLSMALSTTEGVLSSLPLSVNLTAGPNTQTPMSYHISIVSDGSYESNNADGSYVMVSAGDEVYSKIFTVADSNLEALISAGDTTFENGQKYTITSTVSMNSGLTATAKSSFTVDWEDFTFWVDGAVSINFGTLCAYINPFCVDMYDELVTEVTLSVYRRESNGRLTELATGLANDRVTTITDPHPSLDYARYRIVALHNYTGEVFYTDLPGQPILEPSLVVQWDEKWSSYDYTNEGSVDEVPWTGSMVKLPFNVDVSESNNPDVSLVEYVGRSSPVSYYGTQRGERQTWSTVIPRDDKETLYSLRRLAAWMGDVYVREPSGIGYWAQVTVSMSMNHKELTIPVSFSVTRVEGGI